MLAVTVDWTQVLIVGVPAYIAATFAGVATLYTVRVHGQIKTPSGKSLGEVTEYAHDTAIANNMLLSTKNGPTKKADPAALREQSTTPPQVPDDHPTDQP